MVRFSDIIKIQDRNRSPVVPIRDRVINIADRTATGGPPVSAAPLERPCSSQDTNKKEAEPSLYYEKFVSRALDVQARVKGGQNISPSPILSDLHYVIHKDLVEKIYNYVMGGSRERRDFLTHSVDVTFICLMIGMGMGYDVKALLKLGLAAFLENVGMYRIPDEILNKSRTLDIQEAALVKKHPWFSYDILSNMGEKYLWLADMALQVHERSDGSGYPRGIKGDEIMEQASIIGLVDSFTAMATDRPYREKIVKTEAVKSIIEAGKSLFPPRVVKIFFNQISMFPINSFIRLNNGLIGKVTATNKSQPLRPTIEVLFDGSGNRPAKPQIIRLSETPLLHIESVEDPDAYAKDDR